MSKLKGKHGGGGGGCSSCGTPVYNGFTTSAAYDSCDSCGKHGGGGLFSRLRAKFNKGDCGYSDPCATGGCGASAPAGCALPLAPGAVMPVPTPIAPAPMPPKAPEKAPETKKTTQLTVPPVVVTPVSGPRVTPLLGGSGSPF